MSAMPVDPFPTLASQAAETPVCAPSRSTMSVRAKQAAGSAREFCAILGFSGATILGVGAVLAASSTLWALRLDVPYQVALLAGYITLAATACICAAMVAVRYSAPATQAFGQPSTPPVTAAPLGPAESSDAAEPAVTAEPLSTAAPLPTAESSEPRSIRDDAEPESRGQDAEGESTGRQSDHDAAAWKRVDKLRVADAARLWCGLEPGHHATSEVMAWATTILDAVERGELQKSEHTGILAQYRNGWHTEIPTDALKAWATSKGHAPSFLDQMCPDCEVRGSD